MDDITRRRLLRLAPLSALALAGSAGYVLLEGPPLPDMVVLGSGQLLIGRKLPDFGLPGLNASDIRDFGQPALLHIFASWCAPCQAEAPMLLELQRQGTAIWGIAWRDTTPATEGFLHAHGNPYIRVAQDATGLTESVLSVTGVPETWVIDRSGVPRWHKGGGLDAVTINESLLPLLATL